MAIPIILYPSQGNPFQSSIINLYMANIVISKKSKVLAGVTFKILISNSSK